MLNIQAFFDTSLSGGQKSAAGTLCLFTDACFLYSFVKDRWHLLSGNVSIWTVSKCPKSCIFHSMSRLSGLLRLCSSRWYALKLWWNNLNKITSFSSTCPYNLYSHTEPDSLHPPSKVPDRSLARSADNLAGCSNSPADPCWLGAVALHSCDIPPADIPGHTQAGSTWSYVGLGTALWHAWCKRSL